MIREVTGDIVLTKADVLGHAVAPADEFSSGLAASLNQAFPELLPAFTDYCKRLHPMPGDLWTWSGRGKNGPIKVACLFTQQQALKKGEKPGPATLEAVTHALGNLRKFLQKNKAKTCALSKIATGAGGLAWPEVKSLIEKHLGDLPVQVSVYTTVKPGVAAD